MAEIYYLTPNPVAGGPAGSGYSPDGTLPSGAVVCTKAQAQDASSYTVTNGVIGAYTPPAPTAAEQRQAAYTTAMANGVQVNSTGTPAIDGAFAIDDNARANLADEIDHINNFSEFSNGTTGPMDWPLIGNTSWVSIPNFTVMKNLAQGISRYVSQWKQYAAGAPNVTTAPTSPVTIP